MANTKTLEQARYIFNMGKLLRRHLFIGMNRIESDACCKHSDLSIAQMNLIMAVRCEGEITLGELAALLHVSPPSVSVMVDRLVDRGILTRQRLASDRRKVVVGVSPSEDKKIAALEEHLIAGFVTLIEKLGPETTAKWNEVLQEVEKILDTPNTIAK